MSELIREFFPYAPNSCLTCPGLIAAAFRLQSDYSIATEAASEENLTDNLNNPKKVDVRRNEIAKELSAFWTSAALSHEQTAPAIGEALWTRCEGPITVISPRGRIGKPVQKEVCGSQSPITMFFPLA